MLGKPTGTCQAPSCQRPQQPLRHSGRALGAHGAHGYGTGWAPLTAWAEEQKQGELQQEGCPGTAPGHGLRGFGITWNRESSRSWGSGRGWG